MGLIDLSTPRCAIHGLTFTVYRLGGFAVKACPSCTEPKVPLRKSITNRYGRGNPSLGAYAQQSRGEAAVAAWKGKEIALVPAQRRGVKRALTDRRGTPLPNVRRVPPPQRWLTVSKAFGQKMKKRSV